MADLKLPGVGSGFPIQSFVDATVAGERAPKEKMFQRRASDIGIQLSSYGTLKGVLDEFKTSLKKLGDEEAFEKRSTSFSNSGFANATADKTAVAGSYTIVVEQLAEAHKVGTNSIPKADAEKKLGSGSLTLEVGDESFTVSIDKDKSTLADVANAVNNAEDNKGVRATVVTDDNGSRLVFFSEKTGTENTIKVSASGNGDGEGTNDLGSIGTVTPIQLAKDAKITIDGAPITSQSNEIKNAIQGVTLDLKKPTDKADPTKTDLKTSTTLTIGYDKGVVEKNLQEFVKSFNTVMATINQLTSYNAETEKAGPLNGDGTARNLTSQIRRMLSEPIEGASAPIKSLTDLGITTQKDGKIELDEDLLKKQIDDNFSKIGQLFASEEGVSKKLDDMLESFVGKEGVLTKRDSSLNAQMDKLNKERADFEIYMEKYEERVYKQFTDMDIMVAQLNQQLNSVVAAFDNMPSFGGAKQ